MVAGFLFLLFLFVIIIFIVLLSFKSNSVFTNRMILKKLDDLNAEISKMKVMLQEGKIQPEINKEAVSVEKQTRVEKVEPEIIKKEEKPVEPVIEIKKEPVIKQPEIIKEQKSQPVQQVTYQQKSVIDKLQEAKKKTDFEKFIGENLLYKIGVVVLVIVLIFFGKYVVDEGWLNEVAKVTAIIIIGGVLLFIAHRLRTNYKTFSSVMAGAGIAALYIAIAVGFQLYQLFDQYTAFAILVLITIFTIVLSIAYDKKELAVFAIFGGFATPLLVSTGEGNYKVLFTYILILDIGMLVLAYFKKWNLVNFVANFATVLLYSLWVSDAYFVKHKLPYTGALLYVSAFYLVFFIMNIINNVKENKKFTAFEFIMLVTNTFLYYWAGMFIIELYNKDMAGLYTISLAVFNFAFAFPLYKRKQIDKNLVFLLIGLVLTFASIAIPVQLKGNYITISWAAESVILLWLGQQSGIRLMKLASYVVSFLMFISLVMDWNQIYFNRPADVSALPVLLNRGFITGVVSIVSILINQFLIKKEQEATGAKFISSKLLTIIFNVFLIVSVYITLFLEIGYQVDISYSDSGLTSVVLTFFSFAYFSAVLIWSYLKNLSFIFQTMTIVSILAVMVYTFGIMPEYKTVIDYYLMGETQNYFGLIHFLGALSVLVLCVYSFLSVKKIFNGQKVIVLVMLWFTVIMGIIILSREMDYMVLLVSGAGYNDSYSVIARNHLIGWPILWGLLAFVSIIYGMRINEKMLRIIGMVLFFFTLLRFFLVDFMKMPAGGRIIAGASLAVFLIVVSFMYQKLKRIILEDEKTAEKNEAEKSNNPIN